MTISSCFSIQLAMMMFLLTLLFSFSFSSSSSFSSLSSLPRTNEFCSVTFLRFEVVCANLTSVCAPSQPVSGVATDSQSCFVLLTTALFVSVRTSVMM